MKKQWVWLLAALLFVSAVGVGVHVLYRQAFAAQVFDVWVWEADGLEQVGVEGLDQVIHYDLFDANNDFIVGGPLTEVGQGWYKGVYNGPIPIDRWEMFWVEPPEEIFPVNPDSWEWFSPVGSGPTHEEWEVIDDRPEPPPAP